MIKIRQKINKSWKVPLFVIGLILFIVGEIAYNYWYITNSAIMDSAVYQMIAVAWWICITLILSLHEYLFTEKKVLYSATPFILVAISIFIPVINLLLILPIAYYLIIRNMIRAIKQPKVYGGLALSILALAFAVVTTVKSIEVYVMSAKGIISFV